MEDVRQGSEELQAHAMTIADIAEELGVPQLGNGGADCAVLVHQPDLIADLVIKNFFHTKVILKVLSCS